MITNDFSPQARLAAALALKMKGMTTPNKQREPLPKVKVAKVKQIKVKGLTPLARLKQVRQGQDTNAST